jgi:hypothetical protein
VRGRYGFADRELKGQLSFLLQRASGRGVRLSGYREYRDVGDEAEVSLLVNTLAAQEFASDYTDLYDTRGAALVAELGTLASARFQAEVGWEVQEALEVHARPASGAFDPTVPALSLREGRAALRATVPTRLVFGGFELSSRGELRVANWNATQGSETGTLLRGYVSARLERPVGTNRFALHTSAAAVGSRQLLPVQELVFLGGPVSGPGYDFHDFVGRAGVSQHLEWQRPVRFVPISLGRFGKVPSTATLAPFGHLIYTGRDATGRHRDGVYPSVGLGVIALFDVLRADVARGLRDGRWTFSIDFTRAFWGLL